MCSPEEQTVSRRSRNAFAFRAPPLDLNLALALPDTALRLAHYFGTSAQFWLNLQSLYELRLAEQKAGKSIKALPKLRLAS